MTKKIVKRTDANNETLYFYTHSDAVDVGEGSSMKSLTEVIDDTLHKSPQTLTNAEKTQVYANLGLNGVDDVPTDNSNNVVRSGGVKAAIDDVIDDFTNRGFMYKGIAPASAPLGEDKTFYIAKSGDYTAYTGIGDGSFTLNGIAVLTYATTTASGAWTKNDIVLFDEEPTADSDNLVKSGGVMSLANRIVLRGAGSKLVSTRITGLIPGRTYRFAVTPWNYSNSGSISENVALFEIYSYIGGTSTPITTVAIKNAVQRRNNYDVLVIDNDYLLIGLRADTDDKVVINVYDITERKDIGGEGFRYRRFGNTYFNENGYISATNGTFGGQTDGISIYSDNYIAVNPDDIYDVENVPSYLIGFACYNSEKVWMSTSWFSSRSKITVPTGCHYIRLMIRNNNGLTVNTMSGWIGLRFDDGNSERISSLESLVLDNEETINNLTESVDDISETIYGVTPIILSLDDIRGSGEIVGRYIHYKTYKPTVASDTIITRPIYLKAGDTVSVSSGGSGFCIFAKSPTSTINNGTVFTPISTGNSYEGTVAEDGWYCFSGRINKIDGTNLVLEVHTTLQGKSIEEKIDEKADKSEIVSLGGSNGLSFGIKQIKSEIPNYWFGTIESTSPLYDKLSYNTYLENKIDCVPEGKHFIFITDVHYSGQAHCRSASILDYVRRRLGIKTIIHGGDVENENADISLAAKQWLDFNDDFVLRIGGDFKQVCGDHDHNGRYANSDPQLNQAFPYAFVQKVLNEYNINELHYDTLYDDRIATYGWSEAEMKEYDAWKKMHYYYDDSTIKTRFVVLHTGWTGDVGLAVDKIGSNALNEQQSTYLQMDFLYHSLMTIPNGYNVVICGHNVIGNKSYNVDGNIQYNLNEPIWKGSWQQIAKMLRAFRGRTVSPAITYRDWSSSGTLSKTYNFTDAPTINVSFCIGGDVHWDILAKSQTASETLTNVANESHIDKEDDILHVVTMTDGSDRMYKSYPDGELISPQRIEGTIEEQAFDIVTITNNAIYFTRIGAGDDRVVYID